MELDIFEKKRKRFESETLYDINWNNDNLL